MWLKCGLKRELVLKSVFVLTHSNIIWYISGCVTKVTLKLVWWSEIFRCNKIQVSYKISRFSLPHTIILLFRLRDKSHVWGMFLLLFAGLQWAQLGGRAECLPTSICRPHLCSWLRCSTPPTQVSIMLATLKNAELIVPVSFHLTQSLPFSSLSLSAAGVLNEAQTGSVEGNYGAPSKMILNFLICSCHLFAGLNVNVLLILKLRQRQICSKTAFPKSRTLVLIHTSKFPLLLHPPTRSL